MPALRLTNVPWQDEIAHRALKWISPPEYGEAFERAKDMRDEGTCNWILRTEQFNDWQNAPWTYAECVQKQNLGKRALWIVGKRTFFWFGWKVDSVYY